MKVSEYDWQGKRVLVTGASGFKGSWLSAVLLELGAKVAGTTRPQKSALSAFNLLGIENRITKVECDISRRQEVSDAINRNEPDVIFHLAAKALVPVSLRDPIRTFEVNFEGTVNIVEACRKLGVTSRVLICSTDHVFGFTEPEDLPAGGFLETSRVGYGGPYDTSKAAMELAVRSYHHTYWQELPAIGLTRCANVFGFGDTNPRRVVPFFVQCALDDKIIPLRYRHNGRQFIHVVDAVSGYVLAASNLNEGSSKDKNARSKPEGRAPFTPTYHFAIETYAGTDHPFISMGALARQIASKLDASIDEGACIDWAPNENKVQALNCSATRTALGWQARKTMDDGVEDLVRWHAHRGDLAKLQALLEDEVSEVVEAVVAA